MNRKLVCLIIILLFGVSLAAFGRIAGNDFISFDDGLYITKNPYVQSGITPQTIKWAFTDVSCANWHPLTLLSHALDWTLFGADPGGHHVVSLLLHIGAAVFLFLFLNKATGSLWSSAFAAAFFALHPLRVESVAWAAERKDVLSMFFGMACLYAYAFHAERPGAYPYLLCFILFALSLMAKSMLITLPCAMMLLDYWPLKRWRKAAAGPGFTSIGRLVLEKVPFFCLAVAAGVLAIRAQDKGGAVMELENLAFTAKLSNAVVTYASYLGKTFRPVDLAIFYPYQSPLPPGTILISGLILIIVTAAVIYLIKKRPFLAVGWFWYLGTFFPVIGLVQVGLQAKADRYTYLPSVGLAVMLSWGIPLLFRRREFRATVLLPSAMAVLFALAVLTWRQCGYWKDTITIFSHALDVTENNYLAHAVLGQALSEQGESSKSLDHYNQAILIAPRYAIAYNKRGALHVRQGRYQQALDDFNQAIALNLTDAYSNRGALYEKQGLRQQALDDFNQAIALNPALAEAYKNRGAIYEDQGRYQQALDDFNQAIALNLTDAYNKRGALYVKQGRHQQALDDFNKAVALNPAFIEAYNNRGVLHSYLGNNQLAIKDFSRAIQLKEDYAVAYRNRAFIYFKLGDRNAGCEDAKKACELKDCSVLETDPNRASCR